MYDIKKQFEINGLVCVCANGMGITKIFSCVPGAWIPVKGGEGCKTRLMLAISVTRTEGVKFSLLFQRATLLDGLTFLDQRYMAKSGSSLLT